MHIAEGSDHSVLYAVVLHLTMGGTLSRCDNGPSAGSNLADDERIFLFSSESVNEGHPDKLADQVQQRARSETLRT